MIPLALALFVLATAIGALYWWLQRRLDRDLERRLNRMIWPLWNNARRRDDDPLARDR